MRVATAAIARQMALDPACSPPKPGRVSWDTTPGSSRSAYSPLDIEAERARGLHLPAPVTHPAAIAPATTLQHATQNPCWNTVDPAAWFGLDPNQVMHVIHAALLACGAAEQHPTQLTPPPPPLLQLPPPLLNYDDLALPPTVASLSKWLPSPPPAEVPPPVEVSPPLPPAFDPAAPCWPLPTEEDLQQLSRLYKAYKAPPPGFPPLLAQQPPLQPLQLLSQLYNHQACQTYHHQQGQQAGVATSNVQDVPPQHYPVAAYPPPQHHQHHQHHQHVHPDHTYHQHHHQHAPRGEAYHQQQQQQQQLERQYHQHQAQQQHQQRLEEEQQRRSYLQQQQQQAAHFHAQRQAQHYVQQKTPQAAAMYNQHQHQQQHYNAAATAHAAAAAATASYQQHAPPPYQQSAVMPLPTAAAASPPPFSYREAAGPHHHQRHGAQLHRNRHGQ